MPHRRSLGFHAVRWAAKAHGDRHERIALPIGIVKVFAESRKLNKAKEKAEIGRFSPNKSRDESRLSRLDSLRHES
jgi:hypothetical protein